MIHRFVNHQMESAMEWQMEMRNAEKSCAICVVSERIKSDTGSGETPTEFLFLARLERSVLFNSDFDIQGTFLLLEKKHPVLALSHIKLSIIFLSLSLSIQSQSSILSSRCLGATLSRQLSIN